MGIENKIGVSAANPINPYFLQSLTMRLFLGVKILRAGIEVSTY